MKKQKENDKQSDKEIKTLKEENKKLIEAYYQTRMENKALKD